MDNTSTVHIIEICIIRFLPLRGFMQNGLKQQTKPPNKFGGFFMSYLT